MNFNVVDSAEARLCRGQHEQDGVDLPHQLSGQDKVEIPLAFGVENTTSLHNLRGILTYMIQVHIHWINAINRLRYNNFIRFQGESGSRSEKLDFKLRIPSSVFLAAIPIKTDKFAELLASDELTAKIKFGCNGPSLPAVKFF